MLACCGCVLCYRRFGRNPIRTAVNAFNQHSVIFLRASSCVSRFDSDGKPTFRQVFSSSGKWIVRCPYSVAATNYSQCISYVNRYTHGINYFVLIYIFVIISKPVHKMLHFSMQGLLRSLMSDEQLSSYVKCPSHWHDFSESGKLLTDCSRSRRYEISSKSVQNPSKC